MRAHRGVDPAARAFLIHDDGVERLTHPVEALKFERLLVSGHVENGGNTVCIVGGKLRIDPVCHAEQGTGIGDVADICGGFGCENGEAIHAFDLGALDFSVPIGAFDEADHDLAVEPRGQIIEAVDHEIGALAIGLHHDAKAVPPLECGLRERGLDHVEGERQAVGFFGVDVEAHARGFRQKRQRAQARHQHIHHLFALRHFIAWMQSGEFDGNARIFADIILGAGRRDRGDRAGIGEVVADRVRLGPGGLAQHVVGIGVALGLHPAGTGHRAFDGLAQHELTTHFLHGAAHGGADHRLAHAADGGAQMADGAGVFLGQHLACEHQRPG